MVDSVTSGSSGNTQPLTADEMLERAKKAAENKNTSGMSAVEKLLAGRDDDDSDKVTLSPVAKLLAAKTADAEKTSTPYTEQDWYITQKVNQLRGQLETFSTIPGLDPSGGVIDSISKEITGLLKKQQDKLKQSQEEAAAKQKELAAAQAKEYKGVSSDNMLKNAKNAANGIKPEEPISAEAQKLLDNLKKGSSVNTTA
jgi:hypothetical protein